MTEPIKFKNPELSFWNEETEEGLYYPLGKYFNDLPFANYDLDGISNRRDELSKLIEESNCHFTNFVIPVIHPSGMCSFFYAFNIDETKKDKITNGYVPVLFSCSSPDLMVNGWFSWEYSENHLRSSSKIQIMASTNKC